MCLGVSLVSLGGPSLNQKNNNLSFKSLISDMGFMQEGGAFFSVFMSDDISMADYGLTYTPRLNFPLSNEMSISADVPIALGLNFAVNSREGGSGTFSIQLPIKASFNYGLGANDSDGFGFFAGAGLGMGYFAFGDEWSGTYSGFTTGAYIDAGVRAETGKFGPISISVNTLLGKELSVYGLRLGRMF